MLEMDDCISAVDAVAVSTRSVTLLTAIDAALECSEFNDAFELIWYAGLSQQDAADQLGISLRQCQRRWTKARILISRRISGETMLS